jgi:nickel superoxide dismutase
MKINFKKSIASLSVILLFAGLNVQQASAHCEIPCGIYADSIRITMIREDITTIEKAMTQIEELSKSEKPNYNQLVRWVTNKEEHANKIQEVVSQYFLHQRIKIVEPDQKELYSKYQKHLELLHKISVYAMLCKQTTDLANVEKLRAAVDDFEKAYFHKH